MNEIELHYVAHITSLTGSMMETLLTKAGTLRELIDELDARYPGFREVFIDEKTQQLKLNAMIYYGDERQLPAAVIDLDQPVRDKATLTFW
jgi:molybdopterin converting factor small subunit